MTKLELQASTLAHMDPEVRDMVVSRVGHDNRLRLEATFMRREDDGRRAAVETEFPYFTQDAAEKAEMVQTWDETLFQLSRLIHQGDDPKELSRLLRECDSQGAHRFWVDFQGFSQFRGQTVLHLAARAGRTACVRELVDGWNAKLDLRDESGATPLLCAAFKGRDRVVGVLLEAGAKADVRAVYKKWADQNVFDTPEGWAKRLNHSKVLHTFEVFRTHRRGVESRASSRAAAEAKKLHDKTPVAEATVGNVSSSAFVTTVDW